MIAALVDEFWFHRAATGSPDIAGVGTEALQGDDTAKLAVWDYATENWGADMVPFKVGEEYLIETQTLYYVGRVVSIEGGFLVLDDASWVHWTGRLSTLHRLRRFSGNGWVAGERKPRTEFVGQKIVALGAIASASPGPWELPKESIQ